MANTLKFGNGEWYGKKDTILAYNDLNSNYKPLPFNFSRASKATVINKDGLIEELGSGQPRVDYLNNTKGAMLLEPSRTNLITYSSDFPRTYWTKDGATIQGDPSTAGSELITDGNFSSSTYWGGTNAAVASGVATFTGTSGQESTLFQQNTAIVTTSGTLHALTYTVVSNNLQGSAAFYAGFKTTNECIQKQFIPMTVGTHTVYANSVGTGNGFSLHTSVGFTSGSLVIDNVSVKEVQGFTSPDGTNNSYKLVEGTNNGIHKMVKPYTGISGTNTCSIFVKPDEVTKIGITSTESVSVLSSFDLSNGTLISSLSDDYSITPFPNGWFRISSTDIGGNRKMAVFLLDDTGNYSYQGDGTSGVYIYGAQLEEGSYPTSYIPTSGSAVTRLAESCSQTVPDGVIGQTEGTIFAEFKIPETETPSFFSISNGNINNRIIFGYYNGNLAYYVNSSTGSFFTTGIIDSSPIIGQTYKIAVAYKSNDFKIYKNGINTNTETTFTVPSSLTVIDNQGGMGVGQYIFAKVKQFSLYNTRLTNSELAALTQV